MRWSFPLAAVLSLGLACSTGGGSTNAPAEPRGDSEAGDVASQDVPGFPVGPGGGTVTSDDGVATVRLPEGAATQDVAASLAKVDGVPGDDSKPPAFVRVLDSDYVFAAVPAILEKRVTLEVLVAGASLTDDEIDRLVLAGCNGDEDDRGPGGAPRYEAFPSRAERDGSQVRISGTVALRGDEHARFTAVLASAPLERFAVPSRERPADDLTIEGPFDGFITADQKALPGYETLMPRFQSALKDSYDYLTSAEGMGYALTDKQAAMWLPIHVAVRPMAVDPESGAKNLGGFTPAGQDEHGDPWIGLQFDLEAFDASAPVPADLEVAVAHELYHQIQYIYLSQTMEAGTASPVFQKMAMHRWWIESTAYWAQDQVYDGWYPKFVFSDRTFRPLTVQSEPWDEYAGFPLWLWVEDKVGREGVREILLDAAGWKNEDLAENVFDSLAADGLHWADFSMQYLYAKGFARQDSTADVLGATTSEDRSLDGDPLSADLWHESRLGSPFEFVVSPDDGHPKHKQAGNAFYRVELGDGPDSSEPLVWKPKGVLGGLTAVRLDLVNDTAADEATHLTVRVESGVPTPSVRVFDSGAVEPLVQADWLGEPAEMDFTAWSESGDTGAKSKVVIIANANPVADASASVVAEWRLMPAVLVKVSGDGQAAAAGRQLEQPLVVQVKSASGRPMGGIEVRFSVSEESGASVAPEKTSTVHTAGTVGTASAYVKLGSIPGSVAVKAAAFDFLGRPVGSEQTFLVTAGDACGPVAVCPAGCPEGTTCCRRWDCAHLESCPGECVDLDTHNGNCGCCGNRCQGVAGTCCGGVCAAAPVVLSEDPTDIMTEHCCGPDADTTKWNDLCKRERRWALNTWCGPVCEQYCSVGGTWKKLNTAYDNEHCGVSCADCTISGGICCDGFCVDPETNPDHCGACGNHCTGPGATCCGGTCANPWWEEEHCQGCGLPCPQTHTCVGGGAGCWQTGTEPPPPQCDGGIECGYLCAYPEDNSLCGCNGPCKEQEFCCGGICMSDFNFDEQHCGACNKACAAGETCALGFCWPSADVVGCKAPYGGCAYNESCCEGSCQLNTYNDAFCGMCGKSCPEGTACCGMSSPWSGVTDICVDVLSNSQHCGACLAACGLNETCKAGECVSL